MEAVEVADPGTHNGGFEARRLRHGPGRHEAAVAPTHDTHAIAVHQSALDQVINTVQDIFQLFASHITYHGIGKSYAASHAAANVGSQDGIASRGQHLSTRRI